MEEEEIKRAVKILEHHNKWRRCNEIPNSYEMLNPTQIGWAIDVVVKYYRECGNP